MKRFIVFILSITLGVAALAQTAYPTQLQEEKTIPVGQFHSLSVSSRFEVTLQDGPCSVKVTADQALFPYLQVYVRGGVLYLEADDKSIPSDVRKLYRGKNAPTPVVRAIVTLPATGTVSLHQNAILSSHGEIVSDTLKLCLEDKASVRDLKLSVRNAEISMARNSQADFHFSGAVLRLNLTGNARCKVEGESESFSFQADRNARLSALEMKAPRVKADMKGSSEATILADNLLSVRLAGGCALYYTGFPTIQVDEILRSTFAPYKENEQ